jgi:Domain of unknown function (DUF5753)
LDEYAVRRTVGGPEVMRRQLEHLLGLTQEHNITVVIVPESALGLGQIIEPGPVVNQFEVLFDRLGSVALTVADSENLIRAILETT